MIADRLLVKIYIMLFIIILMLIILTKCINSPIWSGKDFADEVTSTNDLSPKI